MQPARRRKVYLPLLLAAFGLALALVPAEARPEYQFGIGITPTSGPPGTVVAVSGSGWTPSSTGNLIFWDAQSGTPIGTFDANPNGAFSTTITVPAGASGGAHTIWACDRCGSTSRFLRPRWTSATFTVILPPTVTPWPTATPIPPTDCDATGLAGEVVIDFEAFGSGENVRGMETEEGVRFLGEEDLIVFSPAVAAHSGSQALISSMMMEFGSSGRAMRIGFSYLQDFVGMYVGLNEQLWSAEPFAATLTAYRLDCARNAVTGEEVCVRAVAGSDSLLIGPEPKDIRECLSVSAPGIFEVTLDYDAGEPELIDDLVLRGPEVPVPVPGDNGPPVVVITDPFEGETFTAGPIRLQGTVQEDVELDRHMRYEIEGGPSGEVNASGFPPSYAFAVDIPVASLVPNAVNTVTVIAHDMAGNEGRDTVSFTYSPPPTPTPTPTLDIIAESVEITQVIQCLDNPTCPDNSVTLYDYKPTLVRFYVRAEGAAEVAGITARLCLWQGEVNNWHTFRGCTDSYNSVAVDDTSDPVRDFRGDLSRTLNFLIPQEWVHHGLDVRLELTVNPDGRDAAECCFDNNQQTRWFSVRRGRELNIVAMRAKNFGEAIPERDIVLGLRWVLTYYPTSNIDIYLHDWDPIHAPFDFTIEDGWWHLLARLDWIRFWTAEGFDAPRYHAFVDPDSDLSDQDGYAWLPEGRVYARSSASVWGSWAPYGDTAGHEILHNHGFRHAPGNCGEAGLNNDYPYYLSSYSGHPYPRASIGEWGIDLYASPFALMDPAETMDIMSYCSPRWMSLYTYQGVADNFDRVGERWPGGEGVAQIRQAGAEVLVASGYLTSGGVELDPPSLFRTAMPADEGLTPEGGDYTVVLLDAQGRSLQRLAFGPQPEVNDPAPDEGYFFLVLPWMEGTTAVEFQHRGQQIGLVPVSASAPQVEVIEPNGGEAWDDEGTETVRWEASDADGDALSAIVQYSADDGATWSAIGHETEASRAEVELAGLSGSSAARIRVCVSDGVNTTCDDSDGAFTLPPKAPVVFLATPEDGQVFTIGELVIMQGLATDREDGSIPDGGAYVWSSDRDGELGTGRGVWGLPLSQGRHTITLTVTDSDGQSGSASVAIIVGSEEAATAGTGSGPWEPPRWIGGVVVGLAAVLGLGLIGIWFRGRAGSGF